MRSALSEMYCGGKGKSEEKSWQQEETKKRKELVYLHLDLWDYLSFPPNCSPPSLSRSFSFSIRLSLSWFTSLSSNSSYISHLAEKTGDRWPTKGIVAENRGILNIAKQVSSLVRALLSLRYPCLTVKFLLSRMKNYNREVLTYDVWYVCSP